MSVFELTKPEKKLARQIIDKGLQIEYANGIKSKAQLLKNGKGVKLMIRMHI